MTIDLETLVELVVRETVNELVRLGIPVETKTSASGRVVDNLRTRAGGRSGVHPNDRGAWTRIPIDLSKYVTPVLTEGHLTLLSEDVREIAIPPGTVITPGAREAIKQRKLTVIQNREMNCGNQ